MGFFRKEKQTGMAMNNWGGVSEHMRVKSRGFLVNRKVARKIDTDLERGNEPKLRELEESKNRQLMLEALVWGTLCLLAALGGLLFFLSS